MLLKLWRHKKLTIHMFLTLPRPLWSDRRAPGGYIIYSRSARRAGRQGDHCASPWSPIQTWFLASGQGL